MQAELQQAAQNMAVGLLVVFAILFFLMLVISLFRFLPKEKGMTEVASPEPVKKETDHDRNAAEAEMAMRAEENALEEELAVVMAAAIAAASEEGIPDTTYQVRRIRRAPVA